MTTEAGYDDHSSYPASVLFGASASLRRVSALLQHHVLRSSARSFLPRSDRCRTRWQRRRDAPIKTYGGYVKTCDFCGKQAEDEATTLTCRSPSRTAGRAPSARPVPASTCGRWSPSSTPSGGDHGGAGGLDKGCVRCLESDITKRCPCPRTGDLDGDGHQARRGGPQSTSGGGGCLGPAWPRVPGSVDDRGAKTSTSPVQGDSPLALGDRAGSLPRRPCPGGGGAAARRVWCRRQKTPARVIDRRRRGLGAPLVEPTTLRRVRSGNKGSRLAPSWGWWPSGHGGEQDGHRMTGWPTPVLVSRGRPGVPPARLEV